ncbi:MAG: hypothetical protein PHR27_09275, partial [Candidatus Cloacimonetes bacterium]|nr:hypothetical protein [Candidatus Cloacimonadota bacterium]
MGRLYVSPTKYCVGGKEVFREKSLLEYHRCLAGRGPGCLWIFQAELAQESYGHICGLPRMGSPNKLIINSLMGA